LKIRTKILSIVLPLLSAAIVLVGLSSYMLAAGSVTALAVEFLNFKADEVRSYADGQWNLLVDNNAVGNMMMEAAAKNAVENFSLGLLRSDTEAIFALDSSGKLAMIAGPASPTTAELSDMRIYFDRGSAQKGGEFTTITVGGIQRAAYTLPLVLYDWQLFVSEDRAVFYGEVENIYRTTLFILIGALLAGIILFLIMASYLTRPIEALVSSMRSIIESDNLEQEAPVYYNDEIGHLSNTFNHMLKELGEAYRLIKRYAFDAVMAEKREKKIRNVFQLYVPKDVIEEVFTNPEKMLVGNNRDLSILFSDIRSFTTISEGMSPDDLVNSLNRYFSSMVDVIMAREGIVDKYIGDAIMAIFGAPVVHENDALQSVLSGLEMLEVLKDFNQNQLTLGAPEFHIGVGINYGEVTVGNIGCEKKMNYTVIGDAVNLASRLEGLTKYYKEPILFTEEVARRIEGHLPCRFIDRVAVKGKTLGVPIFSSRLTLTDTETEIWQIHGEGIEHYYKRRFDKALGVFNRILAIDRGDIPAKRLADRCRAYIASPPPADWSGVEVMTEK
jgi:class 3 adenylate cyclase/HAMP domain-containing protein